MSDLVKKPENEEPDIAKLVDEVKWWGDHCATRGCQVKTAEYNLEAAKRSEEEAKTRFKSALYNLQHAFEDTRAQLDASREKVDNLSRELGIVKAAESAP